MGAASIGEKGIRGEFFAALERSLAGHWVSDLALATKSDQAFQEHAWIWGTPMRGCYAGERLAAPPREDSIGILNRTFEGTIEVLEDEARRDKTGQVIVRVRDLAARSVELWAKMVVELVSRGETALCYDKQPFFDPAHVRQQTGADARPQSNLFTSPAAIPTAPTGPEMLAAMWAGIEGILKIFGYDETFEPTDMLPTPEAKLAHRRDWMNDGASYFVVMMPNTYIAAAARASRSIGGGFGVRFVPLPATWLPWTDRIAVFRADGETQKPFIRQEEFLKMSASPANGATAFNEGKRLYGVSTSRGVGFGLWEHAALVQFVS